MKKITNYFLFLVIIFYVQQTCAQKKAIKSTADSPLITFSTELLQRGDAVGTNVWMEQVAGAIVLHIDSIFNNYTISNTRVQSSLIMTKVFCSFVAENWKDLTNADTVFKPITDFPIYKRQGGLMEFAAYAKVKLGASPDFDKNFIPYLTAYLQPFSNADREKIMFGLSSRSSFFPAIYETELKRIKTKPLVADTALFTLIECYVYTQFKITAGPALAKFANQLIAENFTKADTLRGTINAERAWWDVLRYDVTVKPDFINKTITGENKLQYKVVSDAHPLVMQIDLQEPLQIDSILFNAVKKLSFKPEGNAWHVAVPAQKKGNLNSLVIYYHGKVHQAINPPWDGGWIWRNDRLGNPWMEVTCQGKGASVWFPCKDHQSDEPDNGASLSMIIPDTLVGVANGRLHSTQKNNDGTVTYKWAVIDPINNYDIIPYIGKYVNATDHYNGEKGKLDLNFWVLNYNASKAGNYMLPAVTKMLKALEYWFGPYPFYEDGYKLVEAPAGMEHQTAIAYSNGYQPGAEGRDISGSGWGLKWDYIIVHESAHEWFGNNITTNDIADMWVHEGFGCYSETLYTEYWFGKEAGNEYNYGLRKSILNNFPVIGYYGVNDNISGRNQDMYSKGANLLHTIRHSMDNDSAFRLILRGLTRVFYHQTVNSTQIENYISRQSGYNYSKVFDQYLRNISLPKFEFYFSANKKKLFYHYTDCIDGFNLPLVLKNNVAKLRIIPVKKWNSMEITAGEATLFSVPAIEKMYYITTNEIIGKKK